MEDNKPNQTPEVNPNAGQNRGPQSGSRGGRSGNSAGMQSVGKPEDKKLAFSSEALAPQAPAPEAGRGEGGRGAGGRGRGRGQGGGRRPQGQKSEGEASGLIESVIRISRVAKVTKGGTKLSFSALVVVGDGKGRVGYALGKAAEVAVGIKKGMNAAKKRMVEIPRRGTTIPHAVIGKWCASEVLLKPAGDGTGVIACGPVRAICDGAGIKNILTKVHRSSNPLNVVKATFEGLARLKKVQVNEANVASVASVASTVSPTTK